MSLLSLVLSPFRSPLSGSLQTVFEADIRHNPTIVNPIRQSDDDDSYRKEKEFGFAPQYVVSLRRPKTDAEAQRLYNHIRTVSWYLDAIPLLGRRLPFNIGVESIIGLIPGIGDYIGFVLSLYAVLLSALFGLPLKVLGIMMINIIVDAFIGLIPIIGDALDVAFKANLRNLRLMEDHLISTNGKCHAGQFQLSFPPSNVFLAQESPLRAQPMPEVSGWSTGTSSSNAERAGWNSTFSKASTSKNRYSRAPGPQDFRNGTMKKESSTTIVPKEVFTTMRYEEQGITLQQMCAAIPILSRRLQHDKEKMCIPLLDRHIERLESSVEAMRKHCPREWGRCRPLQRTEMRQKMEDAVKSDHEKGSSKRVRVSVDREGEFEVNTFAMAQSNNATSTQIVRFDDEESQEDKDETPSILYKYKTSHRQMYDNARLRVNANLGMGDADRHKQDEPCFDVIMLHSSYLTESSIANVLIYSHEHDQIYTPPAAKLPLLPGLMRQELLDRGLIIEQDISKEGLQSDLKSNRASLYLCNALRGIVPVALVD